MSDSGPGIPSEQRARVFQRIYRLERSRSTPGNGLGLSLVEAIATLHQIGLELTDNAPGVRVTLRFHAPDQAHYAGDRLLGPGGSRSCRIRLMSGQHHDKAGRGLRGTFRWRPLPRQARMIGSPRMYLPRQNKRFGLEV